MKKIAVLLINKDAQKAARKLEGGFPEAVFIYAGKNQRDKTRNLSEIMKEVFYQYQGIVFFAAASIVIRCIAPFIKNKHIDPAVVCVDTAGRFVISLLCGHEGGANELAYRVANCLDAEPVITTGTQVHRNIIVGVGCRKGISAVKVKKAIQAGLKEVNCLLANVRLAASIDLKKTENGLLKACRELELPLIFISKERIKNFNGEISYSKAALRHIGVRGVCEPCALIAGRRTALILKKRIYNGVTVAIAKERLR